MCYEHKIRRAGLRDESRRRVYYQTLTFHNRMRKVVAEERAFGWVLLGWACDENGGAGWNFEWLGDKILSPTITGAREEQ